MGSLVHGLWIQQEAQTPSPSSESSFTSMETTAETVQVSPGETATPREESPSIPGWAWLLLIPVLAPVLYYIVSRRSKFGGPAFSRRLDRGVQPENQAYRSKVSPAVVSPSVSAKSRQPDDVDDDLSKVDDTLAPVEPMETVSVDATDEPRWKTGPPDNELDSHEFENASHALHQESEFGSDFLDGFDDDSLSGIDEPAAPPLVNMDHQPKTVPPASTPPEEIIESPKSREPVVAVTTHPAGRRAAHKEEGGAQLQSNDNTDSEVLVAPTAELEKISLLESELEAVHAELRQSRATAETLRNQLTASDTALKDTQMSLESTQSRYTETQSRLEEAQSRHQATQTRLDERETLLDELQTRLTESQTRLDATQSRLDDVSTQLEENQARLDGTQSQLDANQAQMDGTQSQLDDVQTRLDQKQAHLDDTLKQLDEVRKQLAVRDDKVAELNRQIARFHEEAKTVATAAQDTAQGIQQRLDDATRQNASLQQTIDSQTARIAELESELNNRSESAVAMSAEGAPDDHASRIAALEIKLDEKRKLIRAAKKKLDERKLKIQRLQRKLIQSRSELTE